ncbi:hypothetical protein [Paraburkholderia pallida]|uniref:Uncharacterized protein n=1 Tax=Paraburkholderia pallida TaxID=2547399 RepID=A0A4V1AZZ3_9BURK|nr:hypothetical protein [Paraburkholderia pallida]QBR00973.1 hypothetical protein E1956_27400 [Paraburkholderia pallida]
MLLRLFSAQGKTRLAESACSGRPGFCLNLIQFGAAEFPYSIGGSPRAIPVGSGFPGVTERSPELTQGVYCRLANDNYFYSPANDIAAIVTQLFSCCMTISNVALPYMIFDRFLKVEADNETRVSTENRCSKIGTFIAVAPTQ